MKRLLLVVLFLVAPAIAEAQSRDTVVVIREVPAYGFKDGAVATVFSVLLAGSGQMYAGKGGKGFAILALSVAGSAIGHNQVEKRKSGGGLYYAVAIGSWLTGVLQASPDVDEFNERRKRSMQSSVGLGPEGLSLRFSIRP